MDLRRKTILDEPSEGSLHREASNEFYVTDERALEKDEGVKYEIRRMTE